LPAAILMSWRSEEDAMAPEMADRGDSAGQQPSPSRAGNPGRGPGRERSTPARSAPAFGSLRWRAGNAIAGLLARAGIGPMQLLTTHGRKTGRPRTCPVVPVEQGGRAWLVAPYGAVGWVHNARAAGRVSLRYGRVTRHYAIREASAGEAGPVLKQYVTIATKTRDQFTATTDSHADDFVAEASRHPVFELITLRGETT
jgi:deazaflavin-dependent oxidoreductase (nitroreductase family)